jgi:hypothetical protein
MKRADFQETYDFIIFLLLFKLRYMEIMEGEVRKSTEENQTCLMKRHDEGPG